MGNLVPRLHLLPELIQRSRMIQRIRVGLGCSGKKEPQEKEGNEKKAKARAKAIKYHDFEDVLHHRLQHRPLEDRSLEALDLSKELVQDTNWILTTMKEKRKKEKMQQGYD